MLPLTAIGVAPEHPNSPMCKGAGSEEGRAERAEKVVVR